MAAGPLPSSQELISTLWGISAAQQGLNIPTPEIFQEMADPDQPMVKIKVDWLQPYGRKFQSPLSPSTLHYEEISKVY